MGQTASIIHTTKSRPKAAAQDKGRAHSGVIARVVADGYHDYGAVRAPPQCGMEVRLVPDAA